VHPALCRTRRNAVSDKGTVPEDLRRRITEISQLHEAAHNGPRSHPKDLNPGPHNGEVHGAKVKSRRSPFDDKDRIVD